MRRIAPVVCMGLGAFLFVGAFALRLYVYPRVAVAPADQSSVTVLEAKLATVFDIGTMKNITIDMTTKAQTTGVIPVPSDCPAHTAVYVNTTSTRSADGIVRTRSTDRAAFDQRTDKAVNCGGEYNETTDGTEEPVKHAGYMYKLPFNTQKKTYLWWDSSMLQTVPVAYEETTTIKGITVYKFVGTVDTTKVGTRDVPGAIVGEDAATVEADSMYANRRTLWVEPNTGVVVDRLEDVKQTLAVDGEERLVTTELSARYTPDTVEEMLDKARLGGPLHMVRTWLPWALGIVGLLMIATGFRAGRDEGDRSIHLPSRKVKQLA